MYLDSLVKSAWLRSSIPLRSRGHCWLNGENALIFSLL